MIQETIFQVVIYMVWFIVATIAIMFLMCIPQIGSRIGADLCARMLVSFGQLVFITLIATITLAVLGLVIE